MLTRIAGLLSPTEITDVLSRLGGLAWEDGAETAPAAAKRKRNQQITSQQEAARPLLTQIGQRVVQHPAVIRWAEPRSVPRIMFARYGEGMYYHSHNDAGLTGPLGRADISFTLFLTAPESSTGGDLVLETSLGEVALKEAAGTLVMYDTGLSHRVTPVTAGERLVVVGWIESLIRSPQAREILRDLGQATRLAAQRDTDGAEAVTLRRVRANLLRMWAET